MGSGPEGVDATRARGRHLVRACNSESNPAKAEEVATAAHGALMALLGRLRLVAPLGLVGLVVSLQLMLLSHPSAVGGLPAPLSLHTFGERVRLICRVWLPWGDAGGFAIRWSPGRPLPARHTYWGTGGRCGIEVKNERQ